MELFEIINRNKDKIANLPDTTSFLVYGSVGRLWNYMNTDPKKYGYGHPTPSSDIDTFVFHESGLILPYSCEEIEGRIISIENGPDDLEKMEGLEHRIIDGWIVFDKTGVLTATKKEMLQKFYSEDELNKRIDTNYKAVCDTLQLCEDALKVDDYRTLSYSLRDLAESGGKVLFELNKHTPTMRRFLLNLKELNKEASSNLLDVIGTKNADKQWIDDAVEGLEDIQEAVYGIPLLPQFQSDKEIQSPILLEDYKNGCIELADEGKMPFAVFPAMMYVSMVTNRRGPAIKTIIENNNKEFSKFKNSPTFLSDLQDLGELPNSFFQAVDKILGVERFTKQDYKKRVEQASRFVTSLKGKYHKNGRWTL